MQRLGKGVSPKEEGRDKKTACDCDKAQLTARFIFKLCQSLSCARAVADAESMLGAAVMCVKYDLLQSPC